MLAGRHRDGRGEYVVLEEGKVQFQGRGTGERLPRHDI